MEDKNYFHNKKQNSLTLEHFGSDPTDRIKQQL